MKIIKLIGGLGNQMFQYALYLKFKNSNPQEMVLVDGHFYDSFNMHNGIELENIFGIKLEYATEEQIKKLSRYTTNYKLSRIYRKVLPKKKSEIVEKKDFIYQKEVFNDGDYYYDGYWQNPAYFDDIKKIIQQEYDFNEIEADNNKKLAFELQNENSVSIHIRRGDYLKSKLYKGLCGIEYYNKAINYIKGNVSNPKFYIFSNDIEWCKNNLKDLNDVTFVNWNTGKYSYLDMQLMSLCKNNIIANSSFSWWAAYLNKNQSKIVCAPKEWLNRKGIGKIQCDDWMLF